MTYGRLRKTNPALFLLFLTPWISSCASAPQQQVKVCPPAVTLQERTVPPWTGKTWGDLATWAEHLATTIEEQNADKRAARAFCAADTDETEGKP